MLTKIHTTENGSDMPTKVLTPDKVQACRKQIGLERHCGFSTLHLVSPHYFCFLCLFRAYIHLSVVAERTSGQRILHGLQ